MAKIFRVTKEAIENYSEEAIFNIISNTYHNMSKDNSSIIATPVKLWSTFNTVKLLSFMSV